MTRFPLLSLAVFLLAACGTIPLNPGEQPREPVALPALSHGDVAGRWDVLSFEAYQPPSRHGAFANFWPHGLSVRLECNRSRIPGVVRDGRLVTQPGPITATEMGCGAELEARDSRFFSFFKRSPSVERLANGRLRLVAGGAWNR
jgi:hypothetical protein